MKRTAYTLLLASAAIAAQANSVAFHENFDGDWTLNFPTLLELDHNAPTASVNPLFMDGDGVSRPWWPGKDSNVSTDRFMMSHACYQNGGKSNDWLVSRRIEIPTEGFVLTFDAQSAPLRDASNLSSLWVFVTEKQVSASNLPTEPAMFLEKVPVGNSVEAIEGDFLHYSLSMDPWAGKKVYLSFANLNENNDILCIDNVLIQRFDDVEMEASGPEYVVAGEYEVTGTARGTANDGFGAWTLTFEAPGCEPQTMTGDRLAVGQEIPFSFTGVVPGDDVSEWSVTLSSPGQKPVVVKGATTGLLFEANHRVLFEEATGAWCSNCPLGIYNVECMLADDELADKVIPVAVHIPGGGNDYMINEQYAAYLGLQSAPMVRVDRAGKVIGFSGYDYNFDKTNPQTVGYNILERSRKLTFADISLRSEFIIQGQDTTGIRSHVEVVPNLTMDHTQHAIGIILTENNVGLDNSSLWRQENGFAGNTFIESELNGWTNLPKKVANMRYQDVARGVWGFNGLDNSLPHDLAGGETYAFDHELEIPDTFQELTSGDKTILAANPIKCADLTVIAYVVDTESCEIVNAVAFPMTEQAEQRVTTRDIERQYSGVGSLEAEWDGEEEYFNLQGQRIAEPARGEVTIIRRGSKVTKEIVR